MATKEELQRAAQRAARAGDRESARELAEAVRSTRMQEEVVVKGSRNRALAEQLEQFLVEVFRDCSIRATQGFEADN